MFFNCIFKYIFFIGILALTGCSFSNEEKKSTQNLGLKIDSDQMMKHLIVFDKIAKDNDGNRAVGTKGGIESANYILSQIEKTGYQVNVIPFENKESIQGRNIIVKIPGELDNSRVIIGAHYDSVKMGAGINDNASGVSLLLELMTDISKNKIKLKNTMYLAFWDSEEAGIAGSQNYVASLSKDQISKIKAYINVDMIGTKNPEVLIADGDRSSLIEMEKMMKNSGMELEEYKPILDGLRSIPSHVDDAMLENKLRDFLVRKNIKVKEDISSLTASDTMPFLGKVPVASIIFFNERMNGNELEFAPCYHKACDTIENIDPNSMQSAADTIVHLLEFLLN